MISTPLSIPAARLSEHEIMGPARPPEAFVPLGINRDRIEVCEGLFAGREETLRGMKFEEGYFSPRNRGCYDAILEGVFQSLTGVRLDQAMTLDIVPESRYAEYIREKFGGAERFKRLFGFDPLEIQGLNIDGTWAFLREKRDYAFLAEAFHEIGHRVFPVSSDRESRELGANVFMLCALEKLSTELAPLGLSQPAIDFGEQPTPDHASALRQARRIVDMRLAYVHRVS